MPKSRGRKKIKGYIVKITPRMRDLLAGQRSAFVKKFGREVGPCDPAFFDPDKNEPTSQSRRGDRGA